MNLNGIIFLGTFIAMAVLIVRAIYGVAKDRQAGLSYTQNSLPTLSKSSPQGLILIGLLMALCGTGLLWSWLNTNDFGLSNIYLGPESGAIGIIVCGAWLVCRGIARIKL